MMLSSGPRTDLRTKHNRKKKFDFCSFFPRHGHYWSRWCQASLFHGCIPSVQSKTSSTHFHWLKTVPKSRHQHGITKLLGPKSGSMPAVDRGGARASQMICKYEDCLSFCFYFVHLSVVLMFCILSRFLNASALITLNIWKLFWEGTKFCVIKWIPFGIIKKKKILHIKIPKLLANLGNFRFITDLKTARKEKSES